LRAVRHPEGGRRSSGPRLRQARDRRPQPAGTRSSCRRKRLGCRPYSERPVARATVEPTHHRQKGKTMAMTVREAFEKGTDTFNAHDIEGFTSVLADDAVFRAPGGMTGQGKEACAQFYADWFKAFPDAHVQVHDFHIAGDV